MKPYVWKEGMSERQAKSIEYILTEKGCWECTSHRRNRKGYVDICRNGIRTKLHRYSYELANGSIPAGMIVLHSCDNPACFNPDHLRIGTIEDNNKDKTAKQRQVKGEAVHTSKLSVEQVIDIQNDERSNRVIAKEYGVAHSTIGRIKRGVNWKDVKVR
jgi:hypothetical protein